MTVYVDDMYNSAMGRYGRMKMSHMIADSIPELHYMADLIGIKRKWFQGDHYDISLSMRDKALENGAQEVTMRQCAALLNNIKRGLPCTPETADCRLQSRL